MSGWIYNLYMGRATAAGYALNEAEPGQLPAKIDQSLKDAGGVSIVNCDATWSSERWNWFGLERFPSAEALIAHKKRAFEMGWFKALDTQVYLGSSDELVEPVPAAEDAMPIYKLWIARLAPATYATPPDQQQALLAKSQGYLKEVGGQAIAFCTCFSDEHFQYFGIERFPSLDAVQEYQRCLLEMDWFNYMDSQVLLGVRA